MAVGLIVNGIAVQKFLGILDISLVHYGAFHGGKAVINSDLADFIERTGHDFNFISEDPKYFQKFYFEHVIVKKINDVDIPMASLVGNVLFNERYMAKWISGTTPEVVVRRIQWEQLKYEKAKEKGDQVVMKLTADYVKKYQPFTVNLVQAQTESLDKFHTQGVLSGTAACRGKVTGQVYVISNPDRLPVIKVNRVVVTRLTTPKLTPLIKKSIAVITDEGGITSHAAIIARELKIPCVIGTKIATKVLKDGDLVEVDAQQGIVRKI